MKLKTLVKAVIQVKYLIKVFDGETFVEEIAVDYCGNDAGLEQQDRYGRAKVKHVSVNHSTGLMEIWVDAV